MAPQTNQSDALHAARSIANHAVEAGILASDISCRPVYQHMGAALADSVLQAGLNYENVVKPRISAILKTFPHASTVNVLLEVIEVEGSSKFLQWKHAEKISRFENLVAFVAKSNIENTDDLGKALQDESFLSDIRLLRGVGPKTIDYMACLVGVDRIAVDRHIRDFADAAGLKVRSYEYLRDVFGYAADLLSVSRREFDASIWRYQSEKAAQQLRFEFKC